MEKANITIGYTSTNLFGDKTHHADGGIKYTGTPAELAELIKHEPYVYVKFDIYKKRNTALVGELSALGLLPERQSWESDEVYWESFNLIEYYHGAAEGRCLKDFVYVTPIFEFV